MNIAAELVIHAKQELDDVPQIANYADDLGAIPCVAPKQVKNAEKAEDMLEFDLARRPGYTSRII